MISKDDIFKGKTFITCSYNFTVFCYEEVVKNLGNLYVQHKWKFILSFHMSLHTCSLGPTDMNEKLPYISTHFQPDEPACDFDFMSSIMTPIPRRK